MEEVAEETSLSETPQLLYDAPLLSSEAVPEPSLPALLAPTSVSVPLPAFDPRSSNREAHFPRAVSVLEAPHAMGLQRNLLAVERIKLTCVYKSH